MEEYKLVYCYCCDRFTEHLVYEGEENTFYECEECGCVIDDAEDEVIFPEKGIAA